jgi:hypothetical protein
VEKRNGLIQKSGKENGLIQKSGKEKWFNSEKWKREK